MKEKERERKSEKGMKQKLEIENVLEFHPFSVCPFRSLASPFSGKLIQQCEKLDTDDDDQR